MAGQLVLVDEVTGIHLWLDQVQDRKETYERRNQDDRESLANHAALRPIVAAAFWQLRQERPNFGERR